MIKTDTIEIKRLGEKKDLENLIKGDIVVLSLGSGKIEDSKGYYGLAIYTGKFNGNHHFFRQQANCRNAQTSYIAYILREERISITKKGVISSKELWTCGYKPELTEISKII